MTSNYEEIITVLINYLSEHTDLMIGELTLNHVKELADKIDSKIILKRLNNV